VILEHDDQILHETRRRKHAERRYLELVILCDEIWFNQHPGISLQFLKAAAKLDCLFERIGTAGILN
jgi:hypothetical protein